MFLFKNKTIYQFTFQQLTRNYHLSNVLFAQRITKRRNSKPKLENITPFTIKPLDSTKNESTPFDENIVSDYKIDDYFIVNEEALEESSTISETSDVVRHKKPTGYYLSEYSQYNFIELEEYVKLLKEHKAQDMVVIDCRDKCSFCTHMIFVTGLSHRHMKVMCKVIVEKVKSLLYNNNCLVERE